MKNFREKNVDDQEKETNEYLGSDIFEQEELQSPLQDYKNSDLIDISKTSVIFDYDDMLIEEEHINASFLPTIEPEILIIQNQEVKTPTIPAAIQPHVPVIQIEEDNTPTVTALCGGQLLKSKLIWPETPERKGIKQSEKLTFVLTSSDRQKIKQSKIEKKMEERLKKERQPKRQKERKLKENSAKNKKKRPGKM